MTDHPTSPYDGTNARDFPPKVVAAANLVLVVAAIACLLVLAYPGYYYGWTGEREFISWAGPLLYFFFPAALAILLFASLRLRPSYRINLAQVLCSAGVSTYALEISLTMVHAWSDLPALRADERDVRAEYAKALGLTFDSRTKREVVHDFLRQGVDAIPSVFPAAFLAIHDDQTVKSPIRANGTELLPLAAIADKLVVLCNESGRWLTYQSDEHGFRNPQGLWTNVPADIAAVGDSYTHGHCIDNHFTALIRQRYPETLNLGMQGNGPLMMLAAIKEYARFVTPKVVLWFYYEGNDLRNQTTERKSALLERYLTDGFSQNLFSRQAEIDSALTAYLDTVKYKSDLRVNLEELLARGIRLQDLRDIMLLAETRKRLGLVYGESTAVPVEPDLERDEMALHETLLEAKRSVNEWGGKLYFVYLPGWYRWGVTSAANERLGVHGRDDVLSAANRAGLHIVDLLPTFERQDDPLDLFVFRLERSHYTEEGNRLVAEQVLRAISIGR